MNKTYLILVAAVFLLGIMPFASAEAVLSADILRYEPLPAQPGQYVTAYIELENTGNEDAQKAAIEIIDQFPFSSISDAEAHKKIGVLKSQQSYVEKFTIRVDSQAIIGNNKLKIRYTADEDNGPWLEKDLTIQVKPNEASLTIINVKTTPEEITPGEEGEITIRVKNDADIVLRDISLQLGLVSASGSTITDLPFIPTDSSTEKKINRLNVGEMKDFSFTVKAYPDATPGYYKLPLAISFYDDEGSQTSSEDIVGVIIKAEPELKIYLEETTITEVNTQGEITLNFVNKGINDLKFLDIEVLEKEEYELLSNSQSYIGDLDSDDYRSETFTIRPTQKDTELDVNVSFKDENNKAYTYTTSVALHFNKTNKAKNDSLSLSTILLIIVVIGIILYAIRRRMKRKKGRK